MFTGHSYHMTGQNQNATITKHMLLSLLTIKGIARGTMFGYPDHYVDSIQREDGSGSSFNVRLVGSFGPKTVYVRTLD